MRLAIVGSREFNDLELVKRYVFKISQVRDLFGDPYFALVSGGAKGVDLCAEWQARKRDMQVIRFNPDWERNGKRAGFIRNIEIVEHTDRVTAFWNGFSHGTRHTIESARVRKIQCNVYFEPRLMREPELEWEDGFTL